MTSPLLLGSSAAPSSTGQLGGVDLATQAELNAAIAAVSGASEQRSLAMELIDIQEVLTEEVNSSSTFVDLATAGPSITFTVPVGEVWDVLARYNATHTIKTAAASQFVIASPSLDGATPDANYGATLGGTLVGEICSAQNFRRYAGVATGIHTIKLQYRSNTGTPAHTTMRRRLELLRVAVH